MEYYSLSDYHPALWLSLSPWLSSSVMIIIISVIIIQHCDYHYISVIIIQRCDCLSDYHPALWRNLLSPAKTCPPT